MTILLIPHVLVGRQQDLEARVLGHGQEVAVLESVPVLWRSRAHGVADQRRANRDRGGLIEQHAHSAAGHWRVEAARRKFDNGFHLVAVQPVVPRQDVVNICPRFEASTWRRHWAGPGGGWQSTAVERSRYGGFARKIRSVQPRLWVDERRGISSMTRWSYTGLVLRVRFR
jgi:hypothetical protein